MILLPSLHIFSIVLSLSTQPNLCDRFVHYPLKPVNKLFTLPVLSLGAIEYVARKIMREGCTCMCWLRSMFSLFYIYIYMSCSFLFLSLHTLHLLAPPVSCSMFSRAMYLVFTLVPARPKMGSFWSVLSSHAHHLHRDRCVQVAFRILALLHLLLFGASRLWYTLVTVLIFIV